MVVVRVAVAVGILAWEGAMDSLVLVAVSSSRDIYHLLSFSYGKQNLEFAPA